MVRARNPGAWDALSPAYRARLERNGVTRQSYTSGAKLAKARGHAKTPEHGVKDAARNPAKYKDYLNKRPTGGQQLPTSSIQEQAWQHGREIFGGHGSLFAPSDGGHVVLRDAYDAFASLENIKGSQGRPGMSRAEALAARNMSVDEWRNKARRQGKFNPFWYHGESV